MKVYRIYYTATNETCKSDTILKCLVAAKDEETSKQKFFRQKQEPISRGWFFTITNIAKALPRGEFQSILY